MITPTQYVLGDVRPVGGGFDPQQSLRQHDGGNSRGKSYSPETLVQENRQYRNTGGVSAVNRTHQFVPAFFDTVTGQAFRSRFANGSPAPIHLLDGLPETLVLERSPAGTVTAARDSVVAGFLRDGQFYSREQAAAAVA